MSWDQKQTSADAVQRQERHRARGLELAKGLGVDGEEALLRCCADGQSEASARGVACLALGFWDTSQQCQSFLNSQMIVISVS